MRGPRACSAVGLALTVILAAGCVKPVPTVDSRRPTLRWDARVDEGVAYDLRIWRAEPRILGSEPRIPGQELIPSEPVYARYGITGSAHTVEIELEPATIHFWTLRERRLIDGQLRVSDWAVLRMDPYGRDDQRLARIPHLGYYRFATPKQ